jgi:amidase
MEMRRNSSSEIVFQSATKLAELIRSRAVSPVEIVEAHLRRIEELNSTLNAIVTMAPAIIDEAKKAEQCLMNGGTVGPLHGIPFTVKDTIYTAGLRTTSGSKLRADFVPDTDAPAVARLKAAGAIVLGKTNTAEMAMDYTADNPVFGRTNNPHDHSRTSGGSSGGEAAAIATSMSPCGLGSDLAGSIRIPAHFCGVFGFKPATGCVPLAGQFPPSAGPYSLGSVIGPIARHVEDITLLFNVLANREPPGESLGEQIDLRGLRCAWYADDGVIPVTDETHQAVTAAARALQEAGLDVEERRPPGIERGLDLWLKLFSRASVVFLRDVYGGHEDEAGAFVRWRLATADDSPPPTLDRYIADWIERDRLRESLLQWMNQTPLIIAPVGGTPAFQHDAHKVTVAGQTISTFRAFSYAQAFNVFDLPAVCVPVSISSEGLPIGVQLVGRPGDENSLLAAALIVEEAFGGWQLAMSREP